MSKAIRFVLMTAGGAIFAGAIAFGVPRNSSTGGYSESWLHRTFAARHAKALSKAQATTLPARDAQAVSLAKEAMSALVGSATITDAKVEGTANFTAGSDQEGGTAMLEAHSGYQSRIELSLSGGRRSEVRSGLGVPRGKRSGSDAVLQDMPLHSCWTDPTWFFPALTLQSALNDPQISFTYVGQVTKGDVAVQHIQISRVVPGQTATATTLIQRLSQVDIFLDAATNLPVAIDFNEHPDTNAMLDLPVEIQFSGWHSVNGIQVPSGIQKLLQGSLTLDLSELTISVNTGLPQSDFAI